MDVINYNSHALTKSILSFRKENDSIDLLLVTQYVAIL